MRTPSEYIAAAVRRVQSSLMPDCKATMTYGAYSGVVTRVSTTKRGEDAVSADGPTEAARLLALVSDFPCVKKGSTVWVDDTPHIVTSLRLDPTGASGYVGISEALDSYCANMRRAGTRISQSINVLAVESDILDSNGDALAPTICRGWFIGVSCDDWGETTAPQIGDEFELDAARMRVAAVKKSDGYWLLTCRTRR